MSADADEKELVECAECGGEFDPDEGGTWIKGIGDVCDDCRGDAGQECVLCGESYGTQEEYWSGLIVANCEFAAHGDLWVPGFYLPTGHFYTGSMIGAGTVHGSGLLFAGWDARLEEEMPEMSGYVCAECDCHGAARAARLYYGKHVKSYGKGSVAVEMESHWMRESLAANPGMLAGHECEPEELEELWERLGIEPERTWSEWLLIDHAGVKVWRRFLGGVDFGECVLRPEPRFREQYVRVPAEWGYTSSDNPHLLSVCELATLVQGSFVSSSSSIYEKEAVEALREAIDLGILTQAGIQADKNRVDWEKRGRIFRERYEGLSDYWKRDRSRGWPDLTSAETAWAYLAGDDGYGFDRPKEDAVEAWELVRKGWDSWTGGPVA